MSSPKQDLIVYNDNSIISEKILESNQSYLSIISHIQGTAPTWLVNSLIENGLQGTSTLITNESPSKINGRSEVVFISFSHPELFYIKNCKKNGLELSNMKNFHYIDCFTDLFTKIIKNVNEPANDIKAMFANISSQIQKIQNSKIVIFFENPLILLQATTLTSNELLYYIFQLNKLCRNLFIITNQDQSSIIDLSTSNHSDPVFKASDFLVKLYHRSQLNIHLKPLETGRANDITGCLIISHGAVNYDIENLFVREQEYIFNLTKDANVSLFYR